MVIEPLCWQASVVVPQTGPAVQLDQIPPGHLTQVPLVFQAPPLIAILEALNQRLGAPAEWTAA